jgi:hypothetical protein
MATTELANVAVNRSKTVVVKSTRANVRSAMDRSRKVSEILNEEREIVNKASARSAALVVDAKFVSINLSTF